MKWGFYPQQHASLVPQDFGASIQIQSSHEPRALRTFLVINRLLSTCSVDFLLSRNRLHLRVLNDFYISLDCLRTLDFSETDIVTLPASIDNLKHLRYLALSHTKITSLPESLCSLYHLQTLDLKDCEDLFELPKGIINLTNPRHLYLPRYVAIIPMPPGIGLLTNLRIVSTFYVGCDREHCVIRELKDLVNLRGELDIGRLQNVVNAGDAMGVLKDKENIVKLILRSGVNHDFQNMDFFDFSLFDKVAEDVSQVFSDKASLNDEQQASRTSLVDDEAEQKPSTQEIVVPKKVDEGLQEGVFDGLRPYINLKELVVQDYYSAEFPSWMADPSFSNLVSVTLDTCRRCKLLPPLGQLPSLRHLVIVSLTELECIGHEFCGQDPMVLVKGFPSLETLHFGSMYKWEEWSGVGNGEFPRLHQLKLNYCRKVRRMPHLLPSVAKLVMWCCEELTVLPALPSLTSLELREHCNEKIWSSMPQDLLSRLQSLKIFGVKDLTSLPLHNLFALRELEISSCQEIRSPCQSFGLLLCNLTSLKPLKILNCPGIWFSPDQQLPSTLQILDIFHCPLLTEWCQRHGFSKLVHISRVILDKKDFHPREFSLF